MKDMYKEALIKEADRLYPHRSKDLDDYVSHTNNTYGARLFLYVADDKEADGKHFLTILVMRN